MNDIIQNRNLILRNEKETIKKICNKCEEQNFLGEHSNKNSIIQEYIVDGLYVYALKNVKDNCKKVEFEQNIIIAPIKLNKITEVDFEEEEYFTSTDNYIGYKTKIESGFWVLSKNNEIRYTLKNCDKKIAVIQIKKNNENSIELNTFSYSSKIERKINEKLNQKVRIMDVILEIANEKDTQDEMCNIQEELENKSQKLILKEFEISINKIMQQESKEEIEIKILETQQMYQKILAQLKIETENMKINVSKRAISVNNEALAIVNKQNSAIKLIKDACIVVKKLVNSNIHEGQKDS